MTREEAKEILPIIQAFAEGKAIQAKESDKWKDINNFNFAMKSAKSYRIKIEPKYRPFKDAKECWNEMLKHQPFGWIVTRDGCTWRNINTVRCDNVILMENKDVAWQQSAMFECFTFADGTPFGIKVEED